MRGTDIKFVHQSARDYLACQSEKLLLNRRDDYGHGEVSLQCVTYLSTRLRANLMDLPRPDTTSGSAHDVQSSDKKALMASMGYPATF